MKRRAVLVLLALSPLAARAQAKLPRVGVLIGRDPGLYLEPLIAALKELGHVDGATIRLETRVAGGGAEQLAAHAEELVRLGVDVIAAFQTPAAKAAQRATRDIPVVFTAGDPVGTGLVASLARPGGNLTGWTGTTAELGGKRLEQLRELLPALRRVAVLINAQDPFAKPFREQIDEGAAALGVTIQPVLLRQGGELEAAFAALDADRPDAVIVQPSLPIRRAAELALRHRLPAASEGRPFVLAGGLMSFAASPAERIGQVATYIDRVLKGARPADLPVVQATRYELIVNLRTAAALGLTLPPSILARADEVIE